MVAATEVLVVMTVMVAAMVLAAMAVMVVVATEVMVGTAVMVAATTEVMVVDIVVMAEDMADIQVLAVEVPGVDSMELAVHTLTRPLSKDSVSPQVIFTTQAANHLLFPMSTKRLLVYKHSTLTPVSVTHSISLGYSIRCR